ncbi:MULTISPECIES: YbaB/EbfC family nucleoid-associated protein [Streptomyces]|uniref:YbaB/EbfC family nucleoid-associated protein n=1 Tax=Streptomyces TaxID=1883 RepID=UPI00240DBB80|nr:MULTISPECIES: YbaB/EbfC family nucleoid-associated protein [Streptomyces]WFB88502.1 YbaB/EbfC family nucleoid-associated protein [Streptomyces olivaceus]WGK50944.1 YbaB/EbfC family nucleoid-associated protein [Streptomyces sp. B146]
MLAEADTELTAQWQKIQEAHKELTTMSSTLRSADRSVEVTVGAQGDLTGIRFLGEKHRTLTAGQLAASVLEAVTGARAQVMARMEERLASVTSPGTIPTWDQIQSFDFTAFTEPLRAEGIDPEELRARIDPERRKNRHA